ncbi:MAG TPA: SDR family oxidoreductase [Alphaproteobacteria bacterium]|nr:SDR family oxidoreductase [Alphaproteobacteria bacterium]
MATARTFLVTGASRGLGRASVEALIKAGQKVVGMAREAPRDGFPGDFVACDLSDPHATAAALASITQRHQILGLVNNVGLSRPESVDKVELAAMDKVFALNLHPAVQAMQAVLPAMRAAGWGRVVNISSLTVLGTPERTSYAAAKAALIAFTRTWALELATAGITVNAVAPGPVVTRLFRDNNPPGSASEQRYLASIPMKRFGEPEEIGAAVAFLLSEAASYITGQTLYVDGGASIGKAPV